MQAGPPPTFRTWRYVVTIKSISVLYDSMKPRFFAGSSGPWEVEARRITGRNRGKALAPCPGKPMNFADRLIDHDMVLPGVPRFASSERSRGR